MTPVSRSLSHSFCLCKPLCLVLLGLLSVARPAAGQTLPPAVSITPGAWTEGDVKWIRDVFPHNKIDDAIDRGRPGDRFDIIVNFRQEVGTAQMNAIQNMGVVQLRGTVLSFVCLSGVSFTDVQAIAVRADVAFIQKQVIYRALLDVACQDVKVRGPFFAPNTVEDEFPLILGDGFNIAIMDSGCDDPGGPGDTNRDLPTAAFNYDGVARSFTRPDDKQGHGTHVAGIALGRGTTGGNPRCPKGVAPGGPPPVDGSRPRGAGLIDVKVLGDEGFGTDPDILGGLQTLIRFKEQWRVGVINMSLGGGPSSDGRDTMCQLVDRASAEGIVVVCAAGNDGPFNDGITAPAAADTAITVGNYDDRNTPRRTDNEIAESSTRGPRDNDGDGDCLDELKPEVSAPGTNIVSAKHDTEQDGIEQTGTSMSAPVVAGICALMLEANPDLTPAQVRQILIDTAERRGQSSAPNCTGGWNRDFGWGMVDAVAAVTQAQLAAGTPQPYRCVSELTLVSPAGNEIVSNNTIRRISWTFAGNSEDTVDIFLNSGNTNLGAIAKGVKVSDLGYDWQVGSPLDNGTAVTPGDQYRVSIRPTFCVNPLSTSVPAFRVIEGVVAQAAPPSAYFPIGSSVPTVDVVAPGGSVKLGAATVDGVETVAIAGMSPYFYRWSPQDYLDNANISRPTASPPRSITYTVTVRDATGNEARSSVHVNLTTPFIVAAGPDRLFAAGSSVVLEGSATGGTAPYHARWTDCDPSLPTCTQTISTQIQPLVRPTETTIYYLTVTDSSVPTPQTQTAQVVVEPGYTVRLINNPGNGGTILRGPNQALYRANELVTFQATAATGFRFDHWEFTPQPGSVQNRNLNPITISFDPANLEVTAVYAQTNSTPSGDQTPDDGSGTGDMCAVTAPLGLMTASLMLVWVGGRRISRRRRSE